MAANIIFRIITAVGAVLSTTRMGLILLTVHLILAYAIPDKIKHLNYINSYPEEKYTVFSKIL